VIVGFGVFGQALLRALVRRTTPEGKSLSITVQTDDADRVAQLVAQLEQAQGRTIQSRPSQAADAVRPGDAVFVCVEDEDAALRSALRLARTVDGRVVLCLQRESPFRQALMETPGLERHAAGYVYGPVRDGNHHPDLVDWPNLSAESQAKDIDAVEQLPDLLAATGLQIQRRRI
jgi:predicted dinucleotide-binding enzyme